jgi:DNA-binding PadR family transcriptional regulator
MSSVRLMVLGVLNSTGEIHGYKIYRLITGWRSETWTNIKPGSIYHALTSLEKKSFIDNTGLKPDSGGPAATHYRVNMRGKEELLLLIRQALISYDQEEFTAGLAWMHLLSRNEATTLAKQRLKQYEQTCAFLRTLPREKKPSTPDKHPEIIGSWTAIFDATTAWLKEFISHLEAGRYHFEGEE